MTKRQIAYLPHNAV